ncbi:IS607 family element RNA-guided endonuclease TnpB [Paractinoplanes maris]|uniref:IS607 family element RNA-guided endonuclease TnpB n=1 Tax=Paractinoplanes maris TaxID=1734446 RepID=UPI002020B863|nr:IS607 family element RNA-guided endonuclease TnpB [Actinoplanes maris]
MKVTQAYRYALDLTPTQQRTVLAHAGAARVAHNWALARVKTVIDQRAAELSYGVPNDQLTERLSWSLAALRRAWNAAKDEVAPWWRECSKEAFNTGLDALARGLKNWSDWRAGRRKGRPVGFPRFKSLRRSSPSVRFTTGSIRVEPDRMHIVLPRLGRLKLHESARKLARRIEVGTARILSATVRRIGGRWHAAFTVEVERADVKPTRPGSTVGVDLGISHLAVLSTGERVPNPRHLSASQMQLRRLGRSLSRKTGPDRRTGRRPSKRWQRASDRLARVHARVANLRREGQHQLTAHLASEYGTIVVEDLNVIGLIANRRMARHIADAGFAEIRRQLTYKTAWNSGRLVVADRWYPSSKTCSGCGAVKAKLALSERDYHCLACGLVMDRDSNAALNLAAFAAELDTAGNGSVAGRGADQKTRVRGQVAVKRQPGTAPAGQTGIVPPQGGTADHALATACGDVMVVPDSCLR